MKDKIINKVLRIVIGHKRLHLILLKHKWYTELLYEQAQKIIGNR